jgi:hypothetical protein
MGGQQPKNKKRIPPERRVLPSRRTLVNGEVGLVAGGGIVSKVSTNL